MTKEQFDVFQRIFDELDRDIVARHYNPIMESPLEDMLRQQGFNAAYEAIMDIYHQMLKEGGDAVDPS
nr:MAG TPA: hypothetical protein [Caudoviricetes sp.]